MPIKFPESAEALANKSKADVQREAPNSNPFLKNSFLGAWITSTANRVYDFYLQLREALRQNFPDTATGIYLLRWAAIYGQSQLPATQSSGTVVATGTAGSNIPLGTVLTVSGVGDYTTTSASTVSNQSINLSDIIRTGSTATATTAGDHNLASGVSVTISGASNSEYNITADIVVTASNQFEYQVSGSPPDEPGTSATASFTTASVPVESNDFGVSVNLDNGTIMRLQSPLAGIDDEMTVDFGQIGGGTDQETENQLRERMLDRIQNPVAQFNAAAITEQAKTINGVTRVFVQEITPEVGQVTIYFMRDNDTDPIPSGSEVSVVEAAIFEIVPANTDFSDVFVLAPTPVTTDFTFGSITPDTATMRTAIEDNLRQFFDERTSVGVNIDEDAYRSAIFNTIDPTTGDRVLTFTLSSPAGDITINSGEIGVLGTVTYL